VSAGNTALHDCAESGSLEIMKMLFAHNAKIEKDSYGLTPLLAAAVAGHARIVEYLTSLPDCTRIDHINAFELLGATFVDKKRDIMGASKLWKAAMAERLDSGIESAGTAAPVLAYGNAVEPRSAGELAEMILDPDAVRMHALLVRERVLGPGHPDTAYYVRYRGAVYADSGDFARCILLWMHALDMQRKHLDALSPATQV
jgi:Ankyrin repeats (3 copies)